MGSSDEVQNPRAVPAFVLLRVPALTGTGSRHRGEQARSRGCCPEGPPGKFCRFWAGWEGPNSPRPARCHDVVVRPASHQTDVHATARLACLLGCFR